MTAAARVQAQAKINLDLLVFPGPDPDGYHTVSTTFHRIDLSDEIQIRLSGTARSLEASGPAMPSQGLGASEKNLAYRAAESYLARNGRGLPRGFEIAIGKRIPVGGGLGGGSADAAAVLRALQALSPTPLGSDELRQVAAALGADVPFLASELVSASGFGRGDRLMPIPFELAPAEMLLVVPSFAIATADAYAWLDADRGPDFTWPRDRAEGGLKPVNGWRLYADAENDFEPVIERRHPKIREYREALKSNGATVARMSGSGSTVFGIFESGAPAPESLGLDTQVMPTRTSARVVQVEVLQ
jgi:4-diphosphocytidyl-2-C-methyl-D-erythritol kinase